MISSAIRTHLSSLWCQCICLSVNLFTILVAIVTIVKIDPYCNGEDKTVKGDCDTCVVIIGITSCFLHIICVYTIDWLFGGRQRSLSSNEKNIVFNTGCAVTHIIMIPFSLVTILAIWSGLIKFIFYMVASLLVISPLIFCVGHYSIGAIRQSINTKKDE